MTLVVRHARGLLIAFVALLFTAGIALGAKALPAASADGLATAAEAAGKTVPVRAGQDAQEDSDEDADEDVEEPEAPVDETEEDAEDDAEQVEGEWANHGAMVSEAAGMETPDGFANHGEWVSCVARLNHGHSDPEATPPTTVEELVELCTPTEEDASADTQSDARGKPDKAEKSQKGGKGKGKGHSGR